MHSYKGEILLGQVMKLELIFLLTTLIIVLGRKFKVLYDRAMNLMLCVLATFLELHELCQWFLFGVNCFGFTFGLNGSI